MKVPLISVCLPNLNTLSYLPERVETILGQTHANWELIVSDNFSEDGAWEFFKDLARKDDRVSIAQAPREGLYANWNNCIRRARGEYVYIATSDDSMATDCLEKLVGALEEHEDCDLAHCTLRTVDEAGTPVADPKWPECSAFADGLSEVMNRRHVRRAPYDGLLHLTGRPVYFSITQLLIRRSLFSRIGDFEPRWGSIGDINWDMKAGLVANTVHVPDTWATFRVHRSQATASVQYGSVEHARRIEEMIQDAVMKCESHLEPAVVAGLRSHWLDWTRDMRTYYAGLSQRRSVLGRRLFQASQTFHGRKATRSELIQRLLGRPKWPSRGPNEIRLWLESLGLDPVITDCAR